MSEIDPKEKLYLQQAMKKMAEVFGDDVAELSVKIDNLEIKRSCLNCEHYSPAGNLSRCEKYNQKPPQHVIENGCISFEFDCLPF